MFRSQEESKVAETEAEEAAPAGLEEREEKVVLEAIGDKMQWNTSAFPDRQVKKTEDVKFEWNVGADEFRTNPERERMMAAKDSQEPSLWAGAGAEDKDEPKTGLSSKDTSSWEELLAKDEEKKPASGDKMTRDSISNFWKDSFERDEALEKKAEERAGTGTVFFHREKDRKPSVVVSRDGKAPETSGPAFDNETKLEETMTIPKGEMERALGEEKEKKRRTGPLFGLLGRNTGKVEKTSEPKEPVEPKAETPEPKEPVEPKAQASEHRETIIMPHKVTEPETPAEPEKPAEPVAETKAEPETPAKAEPEETLSGEALEKELFREMAEGEKEMTEAERLRARQTEKIDKFYTFNKKNEEFQQLLDREYEKFRKSREEEDYAADLRKLGDEGFYEDFTVEGASQAIEMAKARERFFGEEFLENDEEAEKTETKATEAKPEAEEKPAEEPAKAPVEETPVATPEEKAEATEPEIKPEIEEKPAEEPATEELADVQPPISEDEIAPYGKPLKSGYSEEQKEEKQEEAPAVKPEETPVAAPVAEPEAKEETPETQAEAEEPKEEEPKTEEPAPAEEKAEEPKAEEPAPAPTEEKAEEPKAEAEETEKKGFLSSLFGRKEKKSDTMAISKSDMEKAAVAATAAAVNAITPEEPAKAPEEVKTPEPEVKAPEVPEEVKAPVTEIPEEMTQSPEPDLENTPEVEKPVETPAAAPVEEPAAQKADMDVLSEPLFAAAPEAEVPVAPAAEAPVETPAPEAAAPVMETAAPVTETPTPAPVSTDTIVMERVVPETPAGRVDMDPDATQPIPPLPTTAAERAEKFEKSRAEAWDAFFSDDEEKNAGNTFDAEHDKDEEEEPASSVVASILAVILVLLIVLIAVRLFLPDSIVSIKLDQFVEKIMGLFRGESAAAILRFIRFPGM